ncbi:hypothetical protein [Chroococcidiopsis sp. TS-821]|uniref:hypothetical protein n=1 Tax=Chroococcidiopsis sp. TS-821 TaxID=1378066 RepID=UPI000CEE2320|nr:hypothetical protein [Chroococcidiopsis sp. TS-821]PPS45457.1 hypothetical protein B1A85_04190 [Chroococcidiopsis sp. TS-821]
MVHNGIEYGIMQLITEAYDLLKTALGFDHQQLHEVFSAWNETLELNSYLMEITADIFQYIDSKNNALLEIILDAAEQKETGNWTAIGAIDLGVPVPTIMTAVNARIVSAYKEERTKASQVFDRVSGRDKGEGFVDKVRNALCYAIVRAYAEEMALLKAGQVRQCHWNLLEVQRIWKGGCIRAEFLQPMQQPCPAQLVSNLLLASHFKEAILSQLAAWREAIAVAIQLDILILAMSALLSYLNSYRRDRLPQNLSQAQRDYFGLHTYHRIDRLATFHTEWTQVDAELLQTVTAD